MKDMRIQEILDSGFKRRRAKFDDFMRRIINHVTSNESNTSPLRRELGVRSLRKDSMLRTGDNTSFLAVSHLTY